MIPIERRKKIVELVESKDVMSLTELTQLLGVSTVTIRRDLKEIIKKGLLQPVFGGVRAVSRLSEEHHREYYEKRAIPQKQAISLKALPYINQNSCIYLDAGTTTLALAERICERSDLTVISNDFGITDLLMRKSHCKLIHTGGTVNRENMACSGESTAIAIEHLSIDIAFISSTSWDLRGITSSSESKIAVKRALTRSSRNKILLCDSLKFGTVATYLALGLEEFDTLITDSGLNEEAATEIRRKGIELILA